MGESSEGSTLEAAALPKPPVAGIASLAESTHLWNELSERIPADIAEQPSTLVGGSLHSYQLHGLCWLVGMRRAGLNGILADDMGLGKTVQVVAYMLQVRAEQGGCVPSQPFLVAVPASVLSHWAGEIRRWAPSLQLLLYAGPAVKREEAFVRSVLPAARGKARIDVVLTTHDVLAGKTDAPRLRRLAYEALVVDEGHRLKNAACKLHAHLRAYRCRQRLLLTGRARCSNSLMEMRNICNHPFI
ncbi:SNF2 family domain-containing protein, partial [Helicosporidium sp. ATCC 50920]